MPTVRDSLEGINMDYQDFSQPPAGGGEAQASSAVRMPKTEEESIRNRAETQMTSNMIKNSLAELREKLTMMKHNKDFVQVGIKAIDERL